MFGPRVCAYSKSEERKKKEKERRDGGRDDYDDDASSSSTTSFFSWRRGKEKKQEAKDIFVLWSTLTPQPRSPASISPVPHLLTPLFLLPLFFPDALFACLLAVPVYVCMCVVNDWILPEGGPPLATPSSFIRRAVPSCRYTRPSPVG